MILDGTRPAFIEPGAWAQQEFVAVSEVELACQHPEFRFERRLRRRNPFMGEASEGAVEAPPMI